MTQLDTVLADLAAHIQHPATPDLAPAVLAHLRPTIPREPAPIRWQRRLALVSVVLVALLAATLAVPGVRTAVAQWLGIGGVRISIVPVAPDAPAAVPGQLGARVTLEEAVDTAGFRLLAPSDLGDPDEVRIRRVLTGQAVTLLYEDGTLLVTGFPASLDVELADKEAGPGTTVEAVTVDGNPGLWLAGARHAFGFREGDVVGYEDLHRAGPTLLWVQDGVLWRIEGAANRDTAIDLAETLKPVTN